VKPGRLESERAHMWDETETCDNLRRGKDTQGVLLNVFISFNLSRIFYPKAYTLDVPAPSRLQTQQWVVGSQVSLTSCTWTCESYHGEPIGRG